ncbi:MAG: CocE/NonD family hydrolase [Verrucomicrobiae bacterium]|nr:CocE/NonD family hydrolase [Verrucomicrobiae bacterium]
MTRPLPIAYPNAVISPTPGCRPHLLRLIACLFPAAFVTLAPAAETPTLVHHESVLTRDGIPLATTVHLPDESSPDHPAPFPTILIRTPYNKDAVAGFARDGTRRGYAVVAQDTRGRFASQGDNLPFHLDGPDGEDTVRWITQQPWSNGLIGTWGGSAAAITQFQLAATGTRAVTAQFLVVGAPNLYDVVYTGGIFRKSLIEDWLRATQFATNALSIWVGHPVYNTYWRQRDASRYYGRMRAAAVHVGGWWDIFAQPTLDAFVGYQNHGRPGARGRQQLLMGPWTHGVLQARAGELAFPGGDRPPGDLHDAWRWFDRILKGLDNGADRDPAVLYYTLGDVTDPSAPGNVWRTADTWPPLPFHATRLFLHGDRTLSFQTPSASPPLRFTADPGNPVPTLGGIQLTLPAGPRDQRPIESRDDVLVFSSEPLQEPLEITGPVRARLWIASDGPDTDFFVRLCDVYPDDRSFNLCEGMLRARFRQGLDQTQPLVPNRVTRLDIDLWSTSVVFNRGHRLRVHVTSSSAPGFDPNPNTGAPFRADTRTRIATNSVWADPKRPSHLILPLVRPR